MPATGPAALLGALLLGSPPAEAARATVPASEKEPMNAFAFGGAYAFHLLRPRESANGEPLPDNEHMGGIVLAYERVLIPSYLTFTVAKPFFFNRERIDSPLELSVKGMLRRGNWEPFLGVGLSSNIRIFRAEREEREGREIEYSLGLIVPVGITYVIQRNWGFEFEATYAWIPTSHVVEHEIATGLYAVHFF